MNKKLIKFLIVTALLYVVWYFLYQFLIEPFTRFDYYISKNLGDIAVLIFDLFGVATVPFEESYHVVIGLANSTNSGVWIGTECNGLTLFSIFSIFIIAYPSNWKQKLWFIPLGILIIHLLNALRVVALVAIDHYHQEKLEFNHTYTFTFLMYLIIIFYFFLFLLMFFLF